MLIKTVCGTSISIFVPQELEVELDHSKSEVDKARFELQAKEANKYTFQEFIERIEKMQDSR